MSDGRVGTRAGRQHRHRTGRRELLQLSLVFLIGASCIAVGASVFGGSSIAVAQTAPSPTSTVAPPLPAQSDSRADIEGLNRRIDDTRSDIEVVFVLMGLLLAIVLGGGIVGVWSSLSAERRAESRAVEIHSLAIRGETASQLRAEDSYLTSRDSSQRTVNLVNDTLELSRLATERAATTLRQRAEADLLDLDSAAQELLEPVLLGDNFKKVVEDPIVRGGVLELASEVTSIEGYIRSQELQLTPLCFFVKGMDRHLAQQSRTAIKSLREASRHAASEQRDLEAFAQFWAGYELNNVNRPADAAVTFRRAAQGVGAGTPRYFELSRIAIESEFFELATGSALEGEERLEKVQGLDEELARLQASTHEQTIGLDDAAASIANTRGNIWMWGALVAETFGNDIREDCLRRAREEYGDAEALAGSLWSRFGSLEAEFRLSGRVDTDGYRGVEEETLKRLTNRREPRSMALLSETRFISLCRRDAPEADLRAAHKDATDRLREVDDALTLYSQVRKHNVAWNDFATELDDLQQAALSSNSSLRTQ